MTEISIIVAAFNAAGTIEGLLNQIADQTFAAFEVIVINDGSTDETGRIVRQFVARDQRFALVETANGGVAAARQAGVDRAIGEYCIHFDADDEVKVSALETLHRAAIAIDADIVMADFEVKRGDDREMVAQWVPGNAESALQELIDGRLHGGLWNKLIRRRLYDLVRFEPGLNYMEDKLLVARMLMHRVRVARAEGIVYTYVQRPGIQQRTVSQMQDAKTVLEVVQRDAGLLDQPLSVTRAKIQHNRSVLLHGHAHMAEVLCFDLTAEEMRCSASPAERLLLGRSGRGRAIPLLAAGVLRRYRQTSSSRWLG